MFRTSKHFKELLPDIYREKQLCTGSIQLTPHISQIRHYSTPFFFLNKLLLYFKARSKQISILHVYKLPKIKYRISCMYKAVLIIQSTTKTI